MAAILDFMIHIVNVNFVQDCTKKNPLASDFILYIHVYVTYEISNMNRYRLDHGHMVVGFVQSVPITTKVVNSDPVHGKVYWV